MLKKIRTTLLSIALLSTFSLATVTAEAEDAVETGLPTARATEPIDNWMPDKNLQQLVADKLAIPVTEVTPEKLAAADSDCFTWVILENENPLANVTNFTGLEHATKININCFEGAFLDLNLKNYPSVQSKTTVTFAGRLNRTFPDGIDFNQFNNYQEIFFRSFSYNETYTTEPFMSYDTTAYLNESTYSDFRLSHEDFGLHNFSNDWVRLYGASDQITSWYLPVSTQQMHYIISVDSDSGFRFADEDFSILYDQYVSYLMGNTFQCTPDSTGIYGLVPSFPVEFVYNANGNINGQIILGYTLDYTNVTAGKPVTVEHWEYDLAGNPIKKIGENTYLNGNVGERYQAEAINVPGYIFNSAIVDEGLSPFSGLFTNQNQLVKLGYYKVSTGTTQGLVLAQYQDTNGKPISADVLTKGTVGESYSTEQKTISGYTFKEVIG
ncbi:hypothetical protein M2139_001295, partial [Enterococcus sp. PF1-24]